jgi:hypothetical protein
MIHIFYIHTALLVRGAAARASACPGSARVSLGQGLQHPSLKLCGQDCLLHLSCVPVLEEYVNVSHLHCQLPPPSLVGLSQSGGQWGREGYVSSPGLCWPVSMDWPFQKTPGGGRSCLAPPLFSMLSVIPCFAPGGGDSLPFLYKRTKGPSPTAGAHVMLL